MKYVGRATEAFLDTGTRFPRRIVWAMGLIKHAAAKVNLELGLLDQARAEAIMKAAREVAEGQHDGQVVVDVFQTGSGTGINMNVNELVAQRAGELSGLEVHPNDHVNMGQSSNDVVPTAIRVAALAALKEDLIPSLEALIEKLGELAARTGEVIKPGRTHLRDAMPVTMGQEFQAYQDAFQRGLESLKATSRGVEEVPIGGTAVGTGVNAHPEFSERMVQELKELTGLPLKPAASRFRAMRLLTDLLMVSGTLRALATDLHRLCQDLRLMFSGPFTAIGEIDIPQAVPGSSIMPGKTNPVTVEAAMLAAAQVMGLDYANQLANLLGEFELSMGVPLMGYNLVAQCRLLAEAFRKLEANVLARVEPRVERCRELAERSPALVTALSPIIGYDRGAQLAERLLEGKPLREALVELGLSREEVERILDLKRMTRPGIPAKGL